MKQKKTKRKGVAVSNLAELLKPYQSGWVALSSDERDVVGNGETLRETRARAADRGTLDAVFVKVIPPDQGYLPIFL
jgi:hypothetical protein